MFIITKSDFVPEDGIAALTDCLRGTTAHGTKLEARDAALRRVQHSGERELHIWKVGAPKRCCRARHLPRHVIDAAETIARVILTFSKKTEFEIGAD